MVELWGGNEVMLQVSAPSLEHGGTEEEEVGVVMAMETTSVGENEEWVRGCVLSIESSLPWLLQGLLGRRERCLVKLQSVDDCISDVRWVDPAFVKSREAFLQSFPSFEIHIHTRGQVSMLRSTPFFRSWTETSVERCAAPPAEIAPRRVPCARQALLLVSVNLG